jgi:hypothetical protein
MTRAELIGAGYIEPDSAKVYAAMDAHDEQMSRCTCSWDGAPDTRQPRTPDLNCPVVHDDDGEDFVEQARRTR